MRAWILAFFLLATVACGDDDAAATPDGGVGDRDSGATFPYRPERPEAPDVSDTFDDSTADLAPVGTAEQGCQSPSLQPGETVTLGVNHGGIVREYIVHVPPDVDPAVPNPLVINWHGLTSQASAQQALTGFDEPDSRGYIVAFPNGLGNSFNGGVCCSGRGSPAHMADDLGFGLAVIDSIAAQICVDDKRVYSTGMSNGGYMSEHNACNLASVYAAVAPVSALASPRTDCDPARPIPMLTFNGTEDPLVSYAEATTKVLPTWVERNGCTGEPSRKMYGDSYCDTYSDCDGEAEMILCTVTDMAHCWPGNPIVLPGFCETGGLDDIDANVMMYDFFDRHML